MYYNSVGDLVIHEGREKEGMVWRTSIPCKHVHIIKTQLNKGTPFHALSPCFEITREIAAFIATNDPPIL